MKTQLSRWGNSVAVRIPASFLKEAGVSEGSPMNISVEAGKLVLTPIFNRPSYNLEELLADITEDNLHEEYDFGPPVGSEIW